MSRNWAQEIGLDGHALERRVGAGGQLPQRFGEALHLAREFGADTARNRFGERAEHLAGRFRQKR